jgi:hypothetical protein
VIVVLLLPVSRRLERGRERTPVAAAFSPPTGRLARNGRMHHAAAGHDSDMRASLP